MLGLAGWWVVFGVVLAGSALLAVRYVWPAVMRTTRERRAVLAAHVGQVLTIRRPQYPGTGVWEKSRYDQYTVEVVAVHRSTVEVRWTGELRVWPIGTIDEIETADGQILRTS